MAGFRPSQVVIGIAGELVKGFTTAHVQERKKPTQPITDAGAPAAHRWRAARGAARGGARDHLGDRPAACRCPARPCRGHRRHRSTATRSRTPSASRAATSRSASSTRSRRSCTWARCSRSRASSTWSCWRSSRSRMPWRACLGSDQVRQAGALFVDVGGGTTDVALVRERRHRRHPDVRARRPRVHEIASPTGWTCPSRGPRRPRSTMPAASRVERHDEVAKIVSEDVAVWAAGVELVMEELGGRSCCRAGSSCAAADPPAGDRGGAARPRSSRVSCPSAGHRR